MDKEKIVLWGAGGRGQRIAKFIMEKNAELEIVAWIDNNKELWGKDVLGKKVYAPAELQELMVAAQIQKIVMTLDFMKIYELAKQIKEIGVKNVFFIPGTYLMPQYEKYGMDLLAEVDISRPVIGYFEYHICDHCNLNCHGCGHVSNSCDKWFPTLESFEKDLNRTKQLFGMVEAMKLLGGEPLLNPELDKFIEIARKYYPKSEIYVGSNGILIPKCDDKLLEVMKKHEIYFMVTGYPVLDKYKEQIIERLEKYDIPVVFTPKVQKFQKTVMEKPLSNRKRSYENCLARGGRCFTVREGKINPCAIAYFKMLNEKFNANLVITESDEFDLEKETDGWVLAEKLHNPIPFCAYCGTPETFEWRGGSINGKLDDYLISDCERYAIK